MQILYFRLSMIAPSPDFYLSFPVMEDSATLGSDMSAISGLRGGSPFTELPFLNVSYDYIAHDAECTTTYIGSTYIGNTYMAEEV